MRTPLKALVRLRPAFWRAGAPAFVAGVLLSLPACSGVTDPQAEMVRGQTVRGKVTYKGKPVPYGVVLFYNHEKSFDPKTRTFWPSSVAQIRSDGTYEMQDVALGPVMVSVATDPDVDLSQLMRPGAMGPGTPDGGPNAGTPGGPPGGSGGGPPGGRRDEPPRPPPGATVPGPPPPPPGSIPLPGYHGRPKPPNPTLEGLTDAQKQTLRTIHAKYGAAGNALIGYVVREGEQTFDIRLD